jgi:hypothetical protein
MWIELLLLIFMQGIYNYIAETNHVSRVYNFAGILCLQCMVHVKLFPMLKVFWFYISTFRSMCLLLLLLLACLTTCTIRCSINKLCILLHSVFVDFVWVWELTAFIPPKEKDSVVEMLSALFNVAVHLKHPWEETWALWQQTYWRKILFGEN